MSPFPVTHMPGAYRKLLFEAALRRLARRVFSVYARSMVDRMSRERMIEAIRSYMDEATLSDQLDNMLEEITSGTEDATVKAVGLAVWGLYDDLEDHLIVASKEQWDYLNRLLLLLTSDAQVDVRRERFRLMHCAPLLALGAYLYLIASARFSIEGIVGWAVPFGLISMALAWIRRRWGTKHTAKPSTTPFPTLDCLLAVRRSVEHFERKHYPRALAGRRLRSRVNETLLWAVWIPGWLIFSPIILFAQALPDREIRFASSITVSGAAQTA
jgi:hypothetical protein